MRNFTVAALTTVLLSGLPLAARAGTITKVAASPAVVVTGQTVTFTEDGTNPCGAANLNYGDGIVITYPITGLPAQQTHVYEKAGTYTVIAKGMGNCDGEATTTVQVKPAAVPPPPAATKPHITALEFAPTPGIARQPVTFTLKGEGQCRFTVRFGDGNSRELIFELPNRFEHTYAVPGTYTVVVSPAAPCSGKFTERLMINAKPAAPRVFDLGIEPSPADAGDPVTISVKGTGECDYAIDFGDGNNESRSAALPDRFQHNYPAPGSYTVNVTAVPPCAGSARRSLYVRER